MTLREQAEEMSRAAVDEANASAVEKGIEDRYLGHHVAGWLQAELEEAYIKIIRLEGSGKQSA
jgi:hypothetical protein